MIIPSAAAQVAAIVLWSASRIGSFGRLVFGRHGRISADVDGAKLLVVVQAARLQSGEQASRLHHELFREQTS